MARASFAPSLVDPLGQVDSRGVASIEAAIVEQSMSEASSAGRPRIQMRACRRRDAFPGPPSARCYLLRSSCCGRACAAFAGCLLVLLACAAGAARARRPGSNICDGGNANRQVHARIMKEDIFVAPFLILGLAELIKLLQYPTPLRALLTGVNAGLAGGAK